MKVEIKISLVDKNQNLIYDDRLFNVTVESPKDAINKSIKILADEFDIRPKTRHTMFVDDKDGNRIRVGYIVPYWAEYDDTGKRFNGEAWVLFHEKIYMKF